MQTLLDQLVERLRKAHGERLSAVVLYGSAASGEYQGDWSDLNVLCVLSRLDRSALEASEPVIRWWRGRGQPAPLLLSVEEVAESTDCFPIEFHDMMECRRVLYGLDPLAGIAVDDSFYRAQVEHEFRAKLIRLRQKAASALADRDLLVRLMADSVSTFLVLGRHALRLTGLEAPMARANLIPALAAAYGLDPEPFYTLVNLREGKLKPKQVDAGPLYDRYLAAVSVLVAAVDQLEK